MEIISLRTSNVECVILGIGISKVVTLYIVIEGDELLMKCIRWAPLNPSWSREDTTV
jgi:hypothetical protein